MWLRASIPSAGDPLKPAFWFVMSMGLLVGFIVAYPMNWWLVANHLKHGMMTVRPKMAMASGAHAGHAGGGTPSHPAMDMSRRPAPRPPVPVMAVLSFLALVAGLAVALAGRPLW
jgi:Domain of unknown function (DUF4396)